MAHTPEDSNQISKFIIVYGVEGACDFDNFIFVLKPAKMIWRPEYVDRNFEDVKPSTTLPTLRKSNILRILL